MISPPLLMTSGSLVVSECPSMTAFCKDLISEIKESIREVIEEADSPGKLVGSVVESGVPSTQMFQSGRLARIS